MSYHQVSAPEKAPIEPNVTMTRGTHPFSIVCPRFDCYYRTAHASMLMAEIAWTEHVAGQCPMEGKASYLMEERDEKGQRYTMLHVSKSMLEKLWDELDASFDKFVSDQAAADAEQTKGRMRGLAFAIQLMCTHYFESVDDVVREEMKRRSIRTGAIEFEPTPGYQFNPPPVGTKEYEKAVKKSGTDIATKAPRKATAPRQQAPTKMVSLAPEVDEKIRKALATGLFSDEDIAGSFSVTPAYISALRDNT